MKKINDTIFVTIQELTDHVNNYIQDNDLYLEPGNVPRFYNTIQMQFYWACAKTSYLNQTGTRVQEGKHFIFGEKPGEEMLSLQGVKLIEEIDPGMAEPYEIPIVKEQGAALLFQ